MEQKHILVVDDEVQISEVVKAYLQKEGYGVSLAYNGAEAIEVFNRESIDFVILDLMLPKLTGEEVCKKIREKSQVPILMLTAKVAEGDRITGLDIGADDYMIKPFSPKELMARVRAILRRTRDTSVKGEIIDIDHGYLKVNISAMDVKRRNQTISLTPTEFELLALFTQNIGKVFSRDELVIKILGYDYDGYDRTIDTHVKNLRHKIENKDHKYIRTVYGVGYKFVRQEG